MAELAHQHFATMEGAALAAEMVKRFDDFQTDLKRCHDLRRMRLGYLALYGEDEEGDNAYETKAKGADGQARKLKSNQLRVHLLQRINVATADMPDVSPVPVNTDADSMAAQQLAKGALDYYRKDKELDETALEAMLIGEAMLWGWLDVAWDEMAGEPVGEPVPNAADAEGEVTGTVQEYAGDLRYRPLLPVDVAFDIRRRDGLVPWVLIRTQQNKYDIAAMVLRRGGTPEEAEDIKGLSSSAQALSDLSFVYGPWTTEQPRDDVEVLELRHLPCPSAPQGRRAVLVGGKYFVAGATLADGPLSPDPMKPAKDLSLYRYDGGRRIGSPRGYSAVADVTGTQTAIDVLTSVPYTNQRGLGGNVVWTPEGSGIQYNKLSEALAHVTTKSPAHKPEVLQLLSTAPEVFDFRNKLIQELGTAMGMDAVAMGTATDIKSGADAALRDSVTQRAVSGPAKQFMRLLQAACEATLRLLGMNATAQRTLPMVVGKAKAPLMRSFVGADLKGIERVQVEATSPIMRSQQGRLVVADKLLAQKGAGGQPLINEQQFMAVINTGKLEPLTEAAMLELIRIRHENERLSTGEVLDTPPPTPQEMEAISVGQAPPPQVMVTARASDNHPQHIREHMAAGANDEDETVQRNRLAHVQAHVNLWRQTDPLILMACEVPLPPPPPGMMPMGPPGAAPPDGSPPPPDGSGKPPPSGQSEGPNMPRMPKGPTGDEYTPTGGVNANA